MDSHENCRKSLDLQDITTPTLKNLPSSGGGPPYSVLEAFSFSPPSNLSLGGSDDLPSSENNSLVSIILSTSTSIHIEKNPYKVDWYASSHLDLQFPPEEFELEYGPYIRLHTTKLLRFSHI